MFMEEPPTARVICLICGYTKDIVCYMGFSMERDYYLDRKPECVNCGHYPGLWRVYEILEVRLSEFKIY
jgi:hypothetical protein